jgi:hypothetical protein
MELLNAKITTDNKVLLTLKINNNSDVNYVINNNFTFADTKPDFSLGTFAKFNLFVNDTIKTQIMIVRFENEGSRNCNLKKNDVFFIKNNSEELINICLNDYLSEAEKIGLGLKMISENDLSVSLDFYQSEFINIKKRKILSKMRKENYMIFRGQIKTNKVLLNNNNLKS